ncbi:MAG TPA: twin transmembrane helix small protein [Caulobacteraceae bacterium]|jgi:ABC-type Fe3+-siderophore transport system permease subunit|nr:twin transmembrane helix small protein [Caulobacteraceae bacterium]
MTGIFIVLIPLALGAVAITLFAGIYTLFRGGDFALKYSNKLMRMRVLLQFCAILVVAAAVLIAGGHGR